MRHDQIEARPGFILTQWLHVHVKTGRVLQTTQEYR